MADRAHRDLRCCELAAMTVGAGFVTGKPRGRRIVCAFVTGVAGKGIVLLTRVEEFGVVAL